MVEGRETLRLAFVAALQLLSARQRAVLILRDVLQWSAAETAQTLGLTVTAVNSGLRRARSRLQAEPQSAELSEPADRSVLERYVEAFQRADIDALVGLLSTTSSSRCRRWRCGIGASSTTARSWLGSMRCADRCGETVLDSGERPTRFRRLHPRRRGRVPRAFLQVLTIETASSLTTSCSPTPRLFGYFDLPGRLAG